MKQEQGEWPFLLLYDNAFIKNNSWSHHSNPLQQKCLQWPLTRPICQASHHLSCYHHAKKTFPTYKSLGTNYTQTAILELQFERSVLTYNNIYIPCIQIFTLFCLLLPTESHFFHQHSCLGLYLQISHPFIFLDDILPLLLNRICICVSFVALLQVSDIKNLKRTTLFWFMVLIHGWLTSLLWAWGKAEHHGTKGFSFWQLGCSERERKIKRESGWELDIVLELPSLRSIPFN